MFMRLAEGFNLKRCAGLIIAFISLSVLCACASSDRTVQSSGLTEAVQNESSAAAKEENTDMPKLKLLINGRAFTAALYDTPAAGALSQRLPMTVTMQELNGNEKYYYLPFTLPEQSEQIGSIRAGDIMLWGDNCLVLFYESFSTSYRYTKIGHIENPSGLSDAVGTDNVTVELITEGL